MTVIDCPHGVAPERMPKADATGLAPKKSADHNPPVHDSFVREGLAYSKSQIKPYFFGEVLRAEALGLKREDRPAAFAGRSESVFWIFCWWDTARAYTDEYPIPLACSLNTAGRSNRKGIRKCGRGKSGHLRGKTV